jgi:hypothetical protein
MDQVTLDEYITEENQRMIYVFDFFSERAFFIELLEKSDQTSPKETPFIGDARGEPPSQLALDQLMGEEGDSSNYSEQDDDLFDGDDLRLDDLDPDLLDEGFPEDD